MYYLRSNLTVIAKNLTRNLLFVENFKKVNGNIDQTMMRKITKISEDSITNATKEIADLTLDCLKGKKENNPE